MKKERAHDDITRSAGDRSEGEDAPSEGAAAEVAADEALVRTLTGERDELRDLLIRKQAEFENFRKRTERERAEFAQFALADFMKELLNVLDSFELALKNAEAVGGQGRQGIHQGYELTYKQLLESLQRFGLETIDARGSEFDPHVHQAVSTQPSSEVADGMVLEELRRGYLLKGRLLRPAMVTVASSPDPEHEQDTNTP